MPTVLDSADFDLVTTICIDCSANIVEHWPKGTHRKLRKRCFNCLASEFPEVEVRKEQ